MGATKFCPNCGQPVNEGERFCRNCGAQIQKNETSSGTENRGSAEGYTATNDTAFNDQSASYESAGSQEEQINRVMHDKMEDVQMGKMKYCTNCGKPIQEGVKFCGYCGAPVAGYEQADSVVINRTETQAQNSEKAQEDSVTVCEGNKGRSQNRYLVIGCIIAVMLICITAVFFSVTRETEYDSPEAMIEDMYEQCYIQEFNAEKIWYDFMSQKSKSFSFITKDDFISELNDQKGQKKYTNYMVTSCEQTEDGIYTIVGELQYQTDTVENHMETKTDYVIPESASYKLLYEGALSEESYSQTSESLDGVTMENMTVVDCLDQTLVYITIKNDSAFKILIGGNDVAEVTMTGGDGTDYTYIFDDHFLVDPGESQTIEAKYDVRLGNYRKMTINKIGFVSNFGEIFNEIPHHWGNKGFEEDDDAEEDIESPATFLVNAIETYLVNDYDLDKFWEECVSDRTKELAFLTKEEFIEKYDIASIGGEYKGFDVSSSEEAEDGIYKIDGTLRFQASPSGEQSDTYTFYVIEEDGVYKYLPYGATDVTFYNGSYDYNYEDDMYFHTVSLTLSNVQILWCVDNTEARMRVTNNSENDYTLYSIQLTDLSGETYGAFSDQANYEIPASQGIDLWLRFNKIGYAVDKVKFNTNTMSMFTMEDPEFTLSNEDEK